MKLILILLVLIPSSLFARERSEYAYGDHIVEFVVGNTHTGTEDIFTVGLDIEKFPHSMEHKWSFGVSLDVEYAEETDEIFLGPMVSHYPGYHLKLF
jgi:hypothetical protein